jgi:Asp-tRNA(Asn)/Glu-tRNA(Gln) amidotransferase A subunit family amidase
MARSVIDLAILLDATVGVDPADPTTLSRDHAFARAVGVDGLVGSRIGVLGFGASRAVGDVLRGTLGVMASDGAELVEAALPPRPFTAPPPFLDEFRFALEDYLDAHPNAPVRSIDQVLEVEPANAFITPGLRSRAAVRELDETVHEQSLRQRELWRDALVAYMDAERLDALVYPVTTQVAALVGREQDHYDCTISAFSGMPALATPAGFTPDGLPVALELLGRPFDEATLISIAAGLEAHTDLRRPPGSTPPLDP